MQYSRRCWYLEQVSTYWWHKRPYPLRLYESKHCTDNWKWFCNEKSFYWGGRKSVKQTVSRRSLTEIQVQYATEFTANCIQRMNTKGRAKSKFCRSYAFFFPSFFLSFLFFSFFFFFSFLFLFLIVFLFLFFSYFAYFFPFLLACVGFRLYISKVLGNIAVGAAFL